MPASPGNPTIYDVARHAGVSIASVSRVLNGHGSQRPETRDRVLAAVQELGYIRDGAALALSRGLKQVIGVVYRRGEDTGFADEDEGALFDELVNRGILSAAQRAGFDVLISLVAVETAAVKLPELARKTDGLIVHDSVLPPSAAARLAGSVPLVMLVGSAGTGLLTVRCDNDAGMRELTRHLISAHGHRRLGYVDGHPDSPDNLARRRTVAGVAEESGASLLSGPDWAGDYSAGGGANAIARVLASGVQLPEAIICANDQTALGVVHTLTRHGLRVPDDVAVTGYDDVAVARHMHPRLTTVRQPMRELGEAAVALLGRHIGGADPGCEDVVLPVTLVVRESCGCGASAAAHGSATPAEPEPAIPPVIAPATGPGDARPGLAQQSTHR